MDIDVTERYLAMEKLILEGMSKLQEAHYLMTHMWESDHQPEAKKNEEVDWLNECET